MNKLLTSACALLLLLSPQIAKAGDAVFQLDQMSCKEFSQMENFQQGLILFWWDGYIKAGTKQPLLNLTKMSEETDLVRKYCASKPNKKVVEGVLAAKKKLYK